jgi:DNA-binding transcriptional ArsR family regulator
MDTIAKILNRSARTIQRHLHLLKDLGLIEFVERRRYKGRFSSYLYRVLHIVSTTGHRRPVGNTRTSIRGTKPSRTTPRPPIENVMRGYEWLFREKASAEAQETHDLEVRCKREEEANQRRESYEWLFSK